MTEEDRKRRFSTGPGREVVLSEWINNYNFTKVAELGVLDGFTAQEILKSCPGIIEYVGVDTFNNPRNYESLAPQDDCSRQIYDSFDFDYFYNLTKENLADFDDKVNLIKNLTSEASLLFPDEYFDLVFVDADHSYEGVLDDIERWLPKVRSGGILAGHDFNWPGVQKAVFSKLPEGRVTGYMDNVWRYDKD